MSKEDQIALSGMAVTATLVFSCESHREAWLKKTGWLGDDARRSDYERRQGNSDLLFTAAPIGPSESKAEKLQEFVQKVLQDGVFILNDKGSTVLVVCHEGVTQDVRVMPDPDAAMVGDVVLKALNPTDDGKEPGG